MYLLLGQRSNNIEYFDVNKTKINIYDLCRKYPEQVRVKQELHWCQLNVKHLSRKELNLPHSQSLTGNEF